MSYDYFAENPYKKDEAKFNSDKYKSSDKSMKNQLFKIFEKLELI